MADQEQKERQYIAFISYRHKPHDQAVARALHRRIEHYVIPKELRREPGSKKPGLVFRDQDELPVTDSLTDHIRQALDHSQFLIVVCSPDTPASVWVRREISYFLEHHDRHHLLAVLIDGEPAQSFPPELTEVRNADGELTEEVEPLAANLAGTSGSRSRRLFRTESLRILAALIGCPYDALYQRERRYQMRRLGIALAAAACIAAGFIGLLLDRNARIREQLQASRINESAALSALSQTAFREGNYRAALNYALDALPGRDPDRPYVPEAENALSSALYLYRADLSMAYTQSLEQDTEIRAVELSEDGTRLATGDAYGNVRVFDMVTAEQLWTASVASSVKDLYFSGDVLLADTVGLRYTVFDAYGSVLRQEEDDSLLYVDKESGICLSYAISKAGRPAHITDIRTGDVLHDLGAFDESYFLLDQGTVSPDGKYCAVLAKYASDAEGVDLYVFDLETGQRTCVQTGLMYAVLLADYHLLFDDEGNLVLAYCGLDSMLQDREEWTGSYAALYDHEKGWEKRFTTTLDFGTAMLLPDTDTYLPFLGCTGGGIVLAAQNKIIMTDGSTGDIRWQKDLPGSVRAANIYSSGTAIGLILSDGTITMCSTDRGILSQDFGRAFFTCRYAVAEAAISGDSLNWDKYVVVPADASDRIAVVSLWKNKDLQAPAWAEAIPEGAYCFLSPSGTKLAAVRFDSSGENSHLYYVDLSADNPPKEMVFSGITSFDLQQSQDRTALTDTGKLLLCGRVFDLESQTESALTRTGDPQENSGLQMNASCTDSAREQLLTASLEQDPDTQDFILQFWEDGVLTGEPVSLPDALLWGEKPEESETWSVPVFRDCRCRAVSSCGNVVVCGQEGFAEDWAYALYQQETDQWHAMPYMSPREDQVLALAEEHPWMAVQQEDGALQILSLPSGDALLTLEDTLPAGSVTSLRFARSEEWLLAFSSTGALAIYSTADGRELHHSSYGSKGLQFDSTACYTVQEIPQENRILLIWNDVQYTESAAITIDSTSMKSTGFYSGIACYNPADGTVIVRHPDMSLRVSTFFTLEDMQQRAENLLLGKE